MPFFEYKGRNHRGEAVTGRIEGVSPEAVATQLFNSGITPIDIAIAHISNDVLSVFRVRLGGSVTTLDLIWFSRQMYTMLKAGVPIMQSLRGLRDTTQNKALADVLAGVGESLDAGLDLTGALAKHPKVFPSLYVNLVQVGETTGSVADVFLQLAGYLERDKDTRDRIKSATRYPFFVLIAMVVAMFILNYYVIPAFAKLYSGFNMELPWATRLLIATSNFTVAYWYLMLIGSAMTVAAIWYYVHTPEGRYRWHKLKLKLPVVGKIIYEATLDRFARSLAIMMRSGIPLVQGMTVVGRAVDNDFIGDRIFQMRDGIERGETIARTAAATNLFPPLVIQMIAVGEDTGSVDELLLNIADYYEREVDYAIKNLSSAIQPLLIIVLGVLVLILALGVFLPMWDMVKIAR